MKKAQTPKKKWGWPVTLCLWLVLGAVIALMWALFISGPSRVHDEQTAQTKAAIEEAAPGIQDLTRTDFDYVTWQGYTEDTLFWFDAEGQIITTRPMDSLDYNEARNKALNTYGIDADTAELGYGYTAPVYVLEDDETILMLDYDSLDWVYERNLNVGTK